MSSSSPHPLLMVVLLGCGGGAAPAEESKQPTNLEQVRSQVQAGRAQVEGCYQQALLVQPGLRGALELELRLDGGRATNLRFVVDEPNDPALRSCIEAAAQGWRFPGTLREELALAFVFAPG